MANANMSIVTSYSQARRLAEIIASGTQGMTDPDNLALAKLADAISQSVPAQDGNAYYLIAWSGLVSEASKQSSSEGSTESGNDRIATLEGAVTLLSQAMVVQYSMSEEAIAQILDLQKTESPIIKLMPNLVTLAQNSVNFNNRPQPQAADASSPSGQTAA